MTDRNLEIVRAYVCELGKGARIARDRLSASIDALCAAREQAERDKAFCDFACEFFERWAVFTARAMDGEVPQEEIADVASQFLAVYRAANCGDSEAA